MARERRRERAAVNPPLLESPLLSFFFSPPHSLTKLATRLRKPGAPFDWAPASEVVRRRGARAARHRRTGARWAGPELPEGRWGSPRDGTRRMRSHLGASSEGSEEAAAAAAGLVAGREGLRVRVLWWGVEGTVWGGS